MKANLEIKTKVKEILTDKDTMLWLDSLNSESVKMNYPKHLAEYLVYLKISIKTLIKNFENDKKKETKNLQEFVNFQLNKPEPLEASTVANYVSAIKSRLEADGIQLAMRIRIPNRHLHLTVAEETVPTKDQMWSIIENARPETKLIAVLVGFHAIRPYAIGELRIGDFPEMKISKNEITFEKVPTLVNIRIVQSKNNIGYKTFLFQFECDILKTCLEIRLRRGEKLDSNSLIIPIMSKTKSPRKKAGAISRRLITAFEKVNYNQRPYSLKDFCATMLANSGIEQNYQTYFMGHKGPMQNVYSVARKQPPEQIEFMRNLFKNKIEPLLVPNDNNSEFVVKKAFKKLGTELGIEVKEDETMEHTIDSIAEQFKDGHIIYQAPEFGEYDKNLEHVKNNPIPQTQKIITESELADHLATGWKYQNTLPSGSMIVEQVNKK